MCLILLSWQNHPDRPLLVAANRDEYFERPTLAAHFWPESPDLLAGRDQQFGGSWLGLSRSGRFAAITNLRETQAGQRSRGELVKDFLSREASCKEFFDELEREKKHYRPFNFVASDGHSLAHSSNIASGWQSLKAGDYAIGNIPLHSSSEKTRRALADFKALGAARSDPQALLLLMQNTQPSSDLDEPLARMLSCRFVRSEVYGTRSSSIVIAHPRGVEFWEQQYDTQQAPAALAHFSLQKTLGS